MEIKPLAERNLEATIVLSQSIFNYDNCSEQLEDHYRDYIAMQHLNGTIRDAPKGSPEYNEAQHIKKKMIEWYAADGCIYWVVEEKSTVIGTTGLAWTDDGSIDIWLQWFCVHPEFRRKGIGSKLLEHAIKDAKSRRFKELHLWTTTRPDEAAAQGIYERYGFLIYDKKRKRKNNERKKGYTILYRKLKLK